MRLIAIMLLGITLAGCAAGGKATYTDVHKGNIVKKRGQAVVMADPDGTVRHQMRQDPTQGAE